MYIYLLKQTVNKNYYSVNSMVVIAANKKEAINFHPTNWSDNNWATIPNEVDITLIGVAEASHKEGIVCISHNQH